MGSLCERVKKSYSSGFEFMQVMEEKLNICNNEEYELFVVIIRKIWFRKNTVVHGREFIHHNQVIRGAIYTLRNVIQ